MTRDRHIPICNHINQQTEKIYTILSSDEKWSQDLKGQRFKKLSNWQNTICCTSTWKGKPGILFKKVSIVTLTRFVEKFNKHPFPFILEWLLNFCHNSLSIVPMFFLYWRLWWSLGQIKNIIFTIHEGSSGRWYKSVGKKKYSKIYITRSSLVCPLFPPLISHMKVCLHVIDCGEHIEILQHLGHLLIKHEFDTSVLTLELRMR